MVLSSPWLWVLPVGGAFLLAACLTKVLVLVAPRQGWVAIPRQDRWNKRVVAQYGGIPVQLSFLVVAFYFFPTRPNLALMLSTAGMALLGFADDVAGLSPRLKLLGQTFLGGLAVAAGIVLPVTSHIWVNAGITVFWIVGITNALNLLDNMDGLAAGISIIAAIQVVLLAGVTDPISGLALCMIGAIAGFLIFNLNPAKVFMGDVGALSIGFFLACASVKTAEHLSGAGAILFVPCLILFVPVFDTALVSVTRRIHGRRISLGARDHTSHRLVLIGRHERQAVVLLYVIAATAGWMAFLWTRSLRGWQAGIIAFFLICATLFWIYLARLELPASWLSSSSMSVAPMPRRLRKAAAAVVLRLIDSSAIVLGVYLAYLVRFATLNAELLRRFRFTAALALAIQLPLVILFDGHRQKREINRWRDAAGVVISAIVAACLLEAASAILPNSKSVEFVVILLGAGLTSLLLVFCRVSGRIFEGRLSKRKLADPDVDRPAHPPQVQPFNANYLEGPTGQPACKASPAPAVTKRSN
jgi:UDP-GlcNAc:undecaprenyl-phosphate GlcNAc-1-phosphate transferase